MATSRRRWLQFSLRGILAVAAVGCVWLGVVANRAREQREAVKAIESLNGAVRYDWQPHAVSLEGLPGGTGGNWYDPRELAEAKPGGRDWLRRLIGDDFFQEVDRVYLIHPQADILGALPYLSRMPGLKSVTILASVRGDVHDRVRDDLPHCEIQLTP